MEPKQIVEEEVTVKPVLRPEFMEPSPTKSPSPKIKSPTKSPTKAPKLKTE